MAEKSVVTEGVAVGILGKKLGMTQIFRDDVRLPVTVIQAGPCVVLQVKNESTDGYCAVQLGFDEAKPKRMPRPMLGHFAKAGVAPQRFIKEFRTSAAPPLKLGDVVGVSVLQGAKLVDVQGTSKGKGYAGVVKRYHFGGGPASHGNSKHHRHPGSCGRCYSIHKGIPKNRRMAGRMGGETVTVRGLEVVELDAEKNILLVKGAVPGPNGGYLVIRRSIKDPSRKSLTGKVLY